MKNYLNLVIKINLILCLLLLLFSPFPKINILTGRAEVCLFSLLLIWIHNKKGLRLKMIVFAIFILIFQFKYKIELDRWVWKIIDITYILILFKFLKDDIELDTDYD